MRFHLKSIAAIVFSLGSGLGVVAQDVPLRRPAPVTMPELKGMKPAGVSVVQVSDYVYGNYQGDFNAPPHADINPRRAFVIHWRDFPRRFVLSHEASYYCPWFGLPTGVALSYQRREATRAGLFNEQGRPEMTGLGLRMARLRLRPAVLSSEAMG